MVARTHGYRSAASVARLKPIVARKPNISYYVIANADHVMSFPAKQTMDWDKGSLENDKPESAEYFLVDGELAGRGRPRVRHVAAVIGPHVRVQIKAARAGPLTVRRALSRAWPGPRAASRLTAIRDALGRDEYACVRWRDVVEERLEEFHDVERRECAGGCTGEHHDGRVVKHVTDDRLRRGAECQADGELAAALADRVGDNRVDAEGVR